MLTDEQIMIRDMARDFAQEQLAPLAQAREKAGAIEPEVVSALGELGFLGMASKKSSSSTKTLICVA